VDAARATRRRDAVIALLRADGALAWVVVAGEPVAAHATPDRGIVLTAVDTPAHPAPSAAIAAPTPPAHAAHAEPAHTETPPPAAPSHPAEH
jgi:hypothetical protein